MNSEIKEALGAVIPDVLAATIWAAATGALSRTTAGEAALADTAAQPGGGASKAPGTKQFYPALFPTFIPGKQDKAPVDSGDIIVEGRPRQGLFDRIGAFIGRLFNPTNPRPANPHDGDNRNVGDRIAMRLSHEGANNAGRHATHLTRTVHAPRVGGMQTSGPILNPFEVRARIFGTAITRASDAIFNSVPYQHWFGPNSLSNTYINTPVYAALDAVARSPASDPGIGMAIEQAGASVGPAGMAPGAILLGGQRGIRALNNAAQGIRTALRAAPEAGVVGRGFSAAERGIIEEARTIISSPAMAQLEAAHAAGQPLAVNFGGRIIQYEPGLPASGMTMFGDNGFVLGREAFTSTLERNQTVLHELHRLRFSDSAGGVSASLATQETRAAFDFAARASRHLP